MEDINLVSSKICCKLNCVQLYPREKILALQHQLWRNSDIKLRKYIKLKVHRQFHNNTNGNQMVTLEGINVYSTAWQLIMGVSKVVEDAKSRVRAGHHRNFGSKKPSLQTLQAIIILRSLLEKFVDYMLQRSTTLFSEEVVVTKTLHSSSNGKTICWN
jgi:hypothetical protein